MSKFGIKGNSKELADVSVGGALKPDDSTILQIEELVALAYSKRNSAPAETVRLADEITARSETIRYQKGLAQAHNLRGIAATNQAHFSVALRSLLAAYRLFEEIDDQLALANVLSNMNLVYQATGDYAQALNLCFQSLSIAEMLQDIAQQARTLHNIALLYDRQGDHAAALETFERVLVLKQTLDNQDSLALTYGAMSDVYRTIGDDLNALRFIRASVRITRQSGNRPAMAMGFESIGLLHAKHEKWNLALIYGRAALKIQENRLINARLQIFLATIYQKLERTDEAMHSAQIGLALGHELDHPAAVRDAHQVMSSLYEEQDDFRCALHHLKQAMEADKAFQEREKQRYFIELRVRQETDEARREAENERQKNALLQELVHTDHLTGLLNRRAMQERIATAMAQQQVDAIPFTLCIADIDHFKGVNDQYGHDVGDAVLIGMGERLRTVAGENGVVARWGGEEFCLLFFHSDAHEVSKRLQNFLSSLRTGPTQWGDVSLSISLTIGVTDCGLQDTENDLLRRADSALYTGKRAGRDCVMIAPIS